jgi:hypothetical protein
MYVTSYFFGHYVIVMLIVSSRQCAGTKFYKPSTYWRALDEASTCTVPALSLASLDGR